MIKMLEIFNEHWYADSNIIEEQMRTGQDIQIFPSGSTIPSCFAKSKFIQISEHQKGVTEHKEWFNELANDGKALHKIIEYYLHNKHITPVIIQSIFAENMVKSDKINKITRAFLAIQKFINQYNVEPIVLEQSFCNYQYGFGGTRDAIVYMDDPFTKCKKDETPDRIMALLDWKTGSYTEIPRDYEYQMNLYDLDLKENSLFNNCTKIIVCPTAWRKEPDFRLFKIQDFPKEQLLFAINEFNARSTTLADVKKVIYDMTKLKEITPETNFKELESTELLRLLRRN